MKYANILKHVVLISLIIIGLLYVHFYTSIPYFYYPFIIYLSLGVYIEKYFPQFDFIFRNLFLASMVIMAIYLEEYAIAFYLGVGGFILMMIIYNWERIIERFPDSILNRPLFNNKRSNDE